MTLNLAMVLGKPVPISVRRQLGAEQPRQGYRPESLTQHWRGAHAAVHHSHVFAEPSVRSFFYFSNGKK